MRLQKKRSKKPLIITIIIIVLIGVAGAGYYWLNYSSQDTAKQSSDRKEKKKDKKKTTENSTPTTSGETEGQTSEIVHEEEKDTLPAYEGEDPNTSSTLNGAITYSALSGDTAIIRTNINQTLASGTCQLTLKNGSQTVTKTSEIMQNPSSSTCQGFDVPVSELSSGTWSITIGISSGENKGVLTGTLKV